MAALLDEPADSAEELAERVVRKINDMREKEQVWVIAVSYATERGRRLGAMWGPYTTALSARRDAMRRIPNLGPGTAASLYRLVDSGSGEIE